MNISVVIETVYASLDVAGNEYYDMLRLYIVLFRLINYYFVLHLVRHLMCLNLIDCS